MAVVQGSGFSHGIPDNPYNPHAWILGEPSIGANVWIGAFTVIDGSGGLEIGEGCDISCGVQIYTHSTVERCLTEGKAPIARASTIIGDYVHLGANATVLMGARIGSHSVIGAGAVVKEYTTAPEFSLIVGVPARVIPNGAKRLAGNSS